MISSQMILSHSVVRLMRQALVAVMTAWPLLGGHAVSAAEQQDDPLAPWIGNLRSCTGKTMPRIAVVGFERTETAVSREEAEEIRHQVESRLQKAGGLMLTSAADVTRLKAVREGTTGLPAAEAEAQIRAAFDGDATIFFVSPGRQTDRMRFRLQAMTRAADCKATSEPIELALAGTQSLADVGQVMANAVRHLVEAVPGVRFVDVLPFSALAGHSICSDALTDALMVALADEARNPNRALNGKTLTVTRVMVPAPAEAARVSALGIFELDRANRAFINLEFKTGDGATVAPTGRVAIAIERLSCDPAIRPFLDHVAAGARTDRSRLDLSAPVFARGQRLEVLIAVSRPMKLYCWVVAPDSSGYAAPPVTYASVKAGTMRYPRDFGLGDIVLDGDPFENLLACFGTERDLPPALDQLWREHAPGAAPGTEPKLIDSITLTTMMNGFRALPGIVEGTARIVVR